MTSRRRRLRVLLITFLALAALTLVLTWISTDHFRAFGGAPDEAQLARAGAWPQFKDGQFVNLEPTSLMIEGSTLGSMSEFLFGKEMRAPICPLPMATDTARRLADPPATGLRVTWLGHSTTLIEVDGSVVLTDPMWSEHSSPSAWVGPRRFHPPPLALEALPHLDAVVISHEHYDHLDMASIRFLAQRGVELHVPLFIGAHLRAWGVPERQIVEHVWWESASLPSGLRLVSTPARHFNGRGAPGRPGALWTSWALVGSSHRVYFSGDTGLTESFKEIARREGPFDVAMLEIGQYHPSWGDIHLGPVGALDAFRMLEAKTLLPIHWSTFQLGYHAWSDPAEVLVVEAEKRGAPVLTPLLGEPIEPGAPPVMRAWWRALPPIAARCPGE